MAYKTFKGTPSEYALLHQWVRKTLGKPKKCSMCGLGKRYPKRKRIEWANKSHEYKKEKDDWISLCTPCHAKYDGKTGEIRDKQLECKRGHKMVSENIYKRSNGERECNVCKKEKRKEYYWKHAEKMKDERREHALKYAHIKKIRSYWLTA